MGLQFPRYRIQWVIGQGYFQGTVSAEEQKSGWFTPPRETPDQVQRRNITPVQIFQHENQRVINCERFDGFRHFAQHTFMGSDLDFAMQFEARFRVDERGHLRQPHRRMLPQQGYERVARLAEKTTQRFQYG